MLERHSAHIQCRIKDDNMGNEGAAYSQNEATTDTGTISKAEGHTQYAQHAKRRKLAIER